MAELRDLIVYGPSNLIGEVFSDIIHANSFKTNGGTQNDFVKGDGSLDNSEYITDVTVGGTSVVSSHVAVIPSIPDSTSDLTNDSGFITSADVPSPANATPLMDGTAAVGTSTDYAREDHVHPSDTSKQNKLIAGHDIELIQNDIVEIEYLESNNAQDIDTGLIVEDTDIITSGIMFSSKGGDNQAFGSGQTSGNGLWCEIYGNNTWYVRFGSTSSVYTTNTASLNVRKDVELRKNKFSVDNTQILTPSYVSMPTNTLHLFSNYGSANLVGRIYYFKITDNNGNDKLDLIPIRIGTVGYMYDKVSGRLFGNEGSGNFTVGPDIQPLSLTLINFVNNDGFITESSLPTVNNATLTIKQGGVTKGTFTANASSDVIISLESGGGGSSSVIDYNEDTIEFDPETTPSSSDTVSRNINIVSANQSSLSGKLSAKIERIKGTMQIWNQILFNGNFSIWYDVDTDTTPFNFTRHTYAGTTYMEASRINPGDTEGLRMEWIKAYSSGTGYIYCSTSYLVKSHKYYVSLWRRSSNTVRIGFLNSTTGRGSIDFAEDTTGGFVSGIMTASSSTTTSTRRIYLGLYKPVIGDYLEIRNLNIIDLTEIYGAGLEPSAADFELEHLSQYYANMGYQPVGCRTVELVATGYNLLVDGNKTILPAGTYKIEGNYTSVLFSFLKDGYTYSSVSVSNGVFTLQNPGYIVINGYNSSTTCVHKSTGTESYETPYKSTVQLNITELIGTFNGMKDIVFPRGMMKIGNISDEIVSDFDGIARIAIKRIGFRKYEAGDVTSSTMVTDGTNWTVYTLSSVGESDIVYQLDTPINMNYRTDSMGIEYVTLSTNVIDNGTTDVRGELSMDVVYEESGEPILNTKVKTDKRRIEDWRIGGIDTIPTLNSSNVVTSGGIKDYVDRRCKTFYGTCSTAASTATKYVSCLEMQKEDMVPGTLLVVSFSNANTADVASLTLNVNYFGPKEIKKIYNGAVSDMHAAGEVRGTMLFYLSASYWMVACSDYNNTYANYSFGNGYAVDSRTGETPSLTVVTATYGHSTSTNYSLTNNGIIGVHFKYDVGTNATLNISGKGAKPIIYHSAPITGGVIKAGDTATFFYTTFSGVTDYEDGYVLMSIDPRPASISVPYLPLSGGTMLGTGNINMNGTKVVGMSAGTDPEDAVIVNQTIVVDTSDLNDNYTANNKRIKSVATPTLETDAANKLYVDSRVTTPTLSVQDISQNQLDGTVDFNIATVWVTPDHSSSQSNYINFTNKMKPGTICHIMLHSSQSNIDSPALNNYYSGTVDVKIPRNIRVWDSTDAQNGDYEAVWINGELMMNGQLSNNTSLSGQGKKITIPAYGFVEISVMYVEESFKIEKPGAEEDVVMHRTIIKVDSPVVDYNDTYTPES